MLRRVEELRPPTGRKTRASFADLFDGYAQHLQRTDRHIAARRGESAGRLEVLPRRS